MTDVREIALSFEAVKTSLSQNKDGVILRLAIHPNDVPPQLITDWVGTRYSMVAVKLDDDDQPAADDRTVMANRAIKSAGMLARNESFQRFLSEEVHANKTMNEAETINALREYLGVTSRTELRTDREALDRFLYLQDRFERWRVRQPGGLREGHR